MEAGIETGKSFTRRICTVDLVSKVVEKHLGQKTNINIIINYQNGC